MYGYYGSRTDEAKNYSLLQEFVTVVNEMNNHKATGSDGISVELLRALEGKGLKVIVISSNIVDDH